MQMTPATRRKPTRATDEILAERTRIAAGQQLLPPRLPRVGPRLATTWGAALDLDPDQVVEATVIGPPEVAQMAGVINHLGVITPVRGNSFALLSTGFAFPAPGSDVPPPGPEPGSDVPPSGIENDAVTLSLKLKVPDGANQMSLQYNFLSAESPDFIGTAFNDTFSIQVIDDRLGTRELTVASVNSSEFFDVSDSRAKDSGYDIYTADPNGVDFVFTPTGLPDAGLTGFQSFHIDVTGGSTVQVLF
jgi:hypothetical protein